MRETEVTEYTLDTSRVCNDGEKADSKLDKSVATCRGHRFRWVVRSAAECPDLDKVWILFGRAWTVSMAKAFVEDQHADSQCHPVLHVLYDMPVAYGSPRSLPDAVSSRVEHP